MEVINSSKGRKQILLNGYFYRLDRKLANRKESWRCSDVKCKGHLYLVGDSSEITTEHNHVPNAAEFL